MMSNLDPGSEEEGIFRITTQFPEAIGERLSGKARWALTMEPDVTDGLQVFLA